MAVEPDARRDDSGIGARPIVRLDAGFGEPITGVLVLADGRSRTFIGWLGLMSAIEWGRACSSAAGNQG
jgi:hypothetical protein